ncbi:MAG TPA: UvrD-helicase domain-containing protein [Candidatus Eisenbacteria bacterium]|nr:UvrD-helicase domain-containing protein [Candidatus Eisenbacteria bacterium]
MSVERPLADQADRDRIGSDLGTTFVVEAAAGTGKTSALVSRMVAAIAAGTATLERIVAVTFTEAAAGELKLRLRTGIEHARQKGDCPPEDAARLTAALPQLEAARIGTIHAFCAELLRERPIEAGVDPQFQVAPDDVAGVIFARVFSRWFERQLETPGPGVRRVLRRRSRTDGPRGLLEAAARELIEWRDFAAPWQRMSFDRDAEIDGIMADLAALGAEAAPVEEKAFLERSLHEISSFVDHVARREALRGRDYDSLESELIDLSRDRHWKWRGWIRKGETAKENRRNLRDAVKARLDAFVRAAGADLAPLLRDDLLPLIDDYERAKARAGMLDFLDLLRRARDLVRDRSDVRAELQERFTHLFVDEFQDTDPLQVELLLLLAADDPKETDRRRVRPAPGKLFLVGDPKQSIYRFRRADVAVYEAVKRQLVGAGAEVLHLRVSFRAVPELQEVVNAAFAPCMDGTKDGQASYVPLAPYRTGTVTQPALVALPVPQPYGDYGKVVGWKIEDSLPNAIAAFVAWLIRESGWTVTERERPRERVPIAARHVCILFRRMRSWGDDVTRPYVRALEGRQLRHVLVGGSSFHQREEVAALRAALGAIERPDDELALFATLRGPFFALGDGTLLAYRERMRSLHPFRRVPDDLPAELREVIQALAILRELHVRRNRRPFAETIARLLAATRAQAALAIWPTGEQALANVTRLMDLARRAERRGVTSFRAFVESLEQDAARGDAGEAPIIEDGTDGVRIMTVHRAKGLEFPVVILADLTAKATPDEPTRYVDPARGLAALRLAGAAPPDLVDNAAEERARDEEEAVRLLYVAATRARDLLVVPAVGDEPFEGWLSPLDRAIYPDPDRSRVPETATPPGCPKLTGDCVHPRHEKASRPSASVAPGLHRAQAGSHGVVWWAPAELKLDVEENVGLRQQKLLAADEDGVRSERGVRAHEAWQAERSRVRETGATPSIRVVTATELAATGVDEGEVAVESVGAAGARPHGRRFGTLVHAVLAAVDLGSSRAEVTALAGIEGRLLGAPPDEVDAAAAAVTAALAHPLLRRAAGARRLRRETPLAMVLDDGTLVEGVVDAAFEEDGGWTVVDFKTDVEVEGRLDEYRRQVALYARAIEKATGRRASAVLLRV